MTTLFIISLCLIAIQANAVLASANDGKFLISSEQSSVSTSIQQLDRTIINLSLSKLEYEEVITDSGLEYKISLPEDIIRSKGEIPGPDNSVLPTITRLIAIPFDSDPVLTVRNAKYIDFSDIKLATADNEQSEALANTDLTFTCRFQNEIVIGEVAGVMRDIRIYSVTIAPVQYNAVEKSLRLYNELEIEIHHSGTRMTYYDNQLSEAFKPVYKSFLDNPLVFDPVEVTRGAYWLFCPDVYLSNMSELVDWKTGKGFSVVLIPRSAVGTNPTYTTLKNYIQARFDSCLIKPDYITLIGDVTGTSDRTMPTREYGNPYGIGDIESDNYFTFLQGSDYFPEVLIGRICVDNLTELNNYLFKLFTYERTPYMDETEWYGRGLVVAGSDGGSLISTRFTKLWCRDAMFKEGYTQVDTFFATWWDPVDPSEINAVIDNGVSYVNYRGYGYPDQWTPPDYYTYNINQLNNGPMFPIMTSMVCGTGDFNDPVDICFGEGWIRYANRGGSAFVGNSNHDAHTRFTNTLDVGTYWALFYEHVTTLAQAQLFGKMTMYDAFPGDRSVGGQVELYINSYNILGDPEINCWTGIPLNLNVSKPDSVQFGTNMISIQVDNSINEPVSGAYVCLWKDGELFTGDFTDESGQCLLQVSPDSTGPARITITARQFVPLEDTIFFYNNAVTVGYVSHTIDDDGNGQSSGDSDGILNPSETIELMVDLMNFGISDTAIGVTATLSSLTPYLDLIDSSVSYSNMAPGQGGIQSEPFVFSIDPDSPDNMNADLLLSVSASGHTWNNIVQLNIAASNLVVDVVTIIDGEDGVPEPGETFDMEIALHNAGSKGINNATAVLRCNDSRILLLDSTAVYGSCDSGQSFSNTNDHFTVALSSLTYRGHIMNFELEFTGDGPNVTTASFSRNAGTIGSNDPIGPDSHGYYCFDNTDTSYVDHPAYNWVNIDVGNWSYVELQDDDVQTISMPFTVKYYGQEFNTLTICDNGFIAMGDTWWPNFYNGPIPAPQNAPGMMAPFWDDIIQSNLRVYYHYDTEEDRFIVGWQNVYDDDNTRTQTFEIIILNEPSHPTRTHDNEIIFQYNLVQGVMTSSVGICSPDRRDGIGYMFNGTYTAGAAALNNTRAIKFTTRSIAGGCDYVLGDINGNGAANGLDIVYGVNYLKGSIPPPVSCDCPPHGMLYAAGDVNGSCSLNGLDITYFVNYLKGGELVRSCDDCPPARLRPTSQH